MEMPQLRKSGIGGLRQSFSLMDSHKLLGKGLRLFHIPTGPTTGLLTLKSENLGNAELY